MNVERGAGNVKITRLIVKGLHGRYDYDVSFNTDLTFLFGANGCGKTTILDILSSIITGELYRLFNYEFETLNLQYISEGDRENTISIKLNLESEEPLIELIFMNETHSIPHSIFRNESGLALSVRENYFRLHPILLEINKLFPFIYLPLNRKGGREQRGIKRRTRREPVMRTRYNNEEVVYDVDDALLDAEDKILNFQYSASQRKRHLNDKFRNDLIKSLITIKGEDILPKMLEDLKPMASTDSKSENLTKHFQSLLNTCEQSIKKLDILSAEELDKLMIEYKTLFSGANLANKVRDENTETSEEDAGKVMNFFVNMHRIVQVSEIAQLTNDLQSSLEKEDRKFNSFMETIDSFFGDGEDAVTRKMLAWNAEGKIVFRNNLDSEDIELINLSSGEKQLFIFFAYLIFSLQESQPGILVVDEPELSLHLAWQREYVNKIIELQSNVQIIFATHAPELIGQYTDKTMKLSPKLTIEEGVH